MVTRTGPGRNGEAPPSLEDSLAAAPLTVERGEVGGARPPTGEKVQVAAAGPSWKQFLFVQIGLFLSVSLVFGSIAYAIITRPATGGQVVAAPANAVATPAMAMDPAHGGMASPAATGSVARLPLPLVAPPVGQRGPTTVKVNLEIQEVVATLADGVTYQYWTFNGTVPGPMIRVREGDTIEVTLTNPTTSKAAHSIDLHAVTGPGGGAAVTSVAPGETKSFSFKALHAGVFVYHCATMPVPMHIASGMYGLIVVEPPGGLPPVDHEYYVMQGEFYLQGARGSQGPRAYSNDLMLDERPEYVVFNGSVGALTGNNALRAKTGETVRIFFGDGGPNLVSSFHIIGEIFDRVAVEAGSLNDPSRWLTGVQTTLVPAGGATVVEFKTQVPGTYTLVDHSIGRVGKGAAATLIVEGPPNPDIYQPRP